MATALDQVRELTGNEYKYGFTTEVEEDRVPNGLSEDVVRQISAKSLTSCQAIANRSLSVRGFSHWLCRGSPSALAEES